MDGGSRGATWTANDTIVFATSSFTTGLQEIAAAGGPIKVLTSPDRARGEIDHAWPETLPGGRAVLFTIVPATGDLAASEIAVLQLDTGQYKVVLRGGSHAHYIRSGHLVYVTANTLHAVGFDPVALETRGTPVAVVRDVLSTTAAPGGGVDAVVADDGTLAYVRGNADALDRRSLVWVDRQGRQTDTNAPPRRYVDPSISPDGVRVVAWSNDQDNDLWAWDFGRMTLTRLTFAPGSEISAQWSPNGRDLFFASEGEGGRNLFRQAADGLGPMERLTQSPNIQTPTALSPDGKRLIFTETAPKTGEDVMQVDLNTLAVIPLVQSPLSERNGVVSPDARWLAYEGNDSGQFEVYVRPYTAVHSGRWQVSTDGGTRPLWSHDGQELFYVSPAGSILAVRVSRSTSWTASTPTPIVEGVSSRAMMAVYPGRSYDLSPNGRQFLIVKSAAAQQADPPQLIVVQHFDQELKRLASSD